MQWVPVIVETVFLHMQYKNSVKDKQLILTLYDLVTYIMIFWFLHC